MTLAELAKLLDGNVNGPWINIQAPGHGGRDRSLGILFDRDAPDGFRIKSFAEDDPKKCREHILGRLRALRNPQAKCNLAPPATEPFGPETRLFFALKLWDQASSINSTPAET